MKLSILIPHWKTWDWTAVCIHQFKKYPPPVDHEIICIDNSHDSSIKCLTETSLGEGVRIYPGRVDFTSHGEGYGAAYNQASGDRIFCAETDSFPIADGWFEPYLQMAHSAALIGPMVPQSSGPYIHPAGSLYSRELIEAAIQWQKDHAEWFFVPGGAIELGLSNKAFHVVAHQDFLDQVEFSEVLQSQIDLWDTVSPFQEMRAFSDNTFEDYHLRKGDPLEPQRNHNAYLRIGLEPGQWLYWFAKEEGFPIFEVFSKIEWIDGLHGQQAKWSYVFDRFIHCWGGSVFSQSTDYDPRAKTFKKWQQEYWFSQLPEDIQKQITQLKEKYALANH